MFKNTCILINFVRRTIAFYSKTKFETRCTVVEIYMFIDPNSKLKKKRRNKKKEKILNLSLQLLYL